jgi:hypothetical protein
MTVNAGFNIDPSVWGPHVWATMHTLALKSDADNEIKAFSDFLNSLTYLLPCDTCRNEYSKWFGAQRPELGHAFEWTVKLHNFVNGKLSKVQVGLEEARDLWQSDHCSYKCGVETKSNLWLLVLLVVCILVALKCSSIL